LFRSKYYRNGKAADVRFKTTGKEILKGWRVVLKPDAKEKKADY
jgi:hypothetical protein